MANNDVTRISQIHDDLLIVRASYGPRQRDLETEVKCRGRRVYRTNLVETRNGRIYVWCQFADTNEFAWINAANLREKHIGAQPFGIAA